MRIVPGLVSHVGIKLGSCLVKLCLSKSIMLLEEEYYNVHSPCSYKRIYILHKNIHPTRVEIRAIWEIALS